MATQKKPKPKRKPTPKITAREKKTLATRAAFNKVCDLIADGPKESVKEITADSKIGISRSGFYYLLRAGDTELLDRYAQARAMQADRLAGEIITISDDAMGDYKLVKRKGATGDAVKNYDVLPDSDSVQRARLRVESRKWLASKLDAKVYGDRQTVDVNLKLEQMDDDELLAHTKQLAERLGITLPAKLLKPARHEGAGD